MSIVVKRHKAELDRKQQEEELARLHESDRILTILQRFGVSIYGSRYEPRTGLSVYEIEKPEMEKLVTHLERLLDRLP